MTPEQMFDVFLEEALKRFQRPKYLVESAPVPLPDPDSRWLWQWAPFHAIDGDVQVRESAKAILDRFDRSDLQPPDHLGVTIVDPIISARQIPKPVTDLVDPVCCERIVNGIWVQAGFGETIKADPVLSPKSPRVPARTVISYYAVVFLNIKSTPC